MADTDGLQQQIAEVLRFHRWKSSGDFFACACGHVPESSLHMEDHRASSLLPVVAAWAEQQARQRAVEELRAVAEELRSDRDDATTGEDPGDPWTYNEAALTCTQRADALTTEDPARSLGRK